MGQKVHPLGFRVGITKKHQSQWFARFNKYKYSQSILEDRMIRETLSKLFPELLNPIHHTMGHPNDSVTTLLGKEARSKVEKKKRDDEIAITPRITQIKIERGLIPYEIGIQIHAENCDLLKSSIDNLKVKRELIIKLQKTRRYLLNLKLTSTFGKAVPNTQSTNTNAQTLKFNSAGIKPVPLWGSAELKVQHPSFSAPKGSYYASHNSFGKGKPIPAYSLDFVDEARKKGEEQDGKKLSLRDKMYQRKESFLRMSQSKRSPYKKDKISSKAISSSIRSFAGSKLTKQELRRQRLIKKRLKKRQSIRNRYRQLILKGLFIDQIAGMGTSSYSSEAGGSTTKILQTLLFKKTGNKKVMGSSASSDITIPPTGIMRRSFSKEKFPRRDGPGPTLSVDKSNKNIFSSRIKKKFLTLFIQKMNKKFLSHLKLVLMNSNSTKTTPIGSDRSNELTFIPTEGENQIIFSAKQGDKREKGINLIGSRILTPLGYNTQWNLSRLHILRKQPIYKLNKMIVVLEQKLLVKLESLRKEFIAFGNSPLLLPRRGKNEGMFSSGTQSAGKKAPFPFWFPTGASRHLGMKGRLCVAKNKNPNMSLTVTPEITGSGNFKEEPAGSSGYMPVDPEKVLYPIELFHPLHPEDCKKEGEGKHGADSLSPSAYGKDNSSLGQILKYLKNLKDLVNKLKREQKLQQIYNPLSADLKIASRLSLDPHSTVLRPGLSASNADMRGGIQPSTAGSETERFIFPFFSATLRAQETLRGPSLISIGDRETVLYNKLNNIEDECRKVKLIEYIKDIVKKHRTENIYLYLSTIADARKDLRKIKQFTKHHADFLFGLNLVSISSFGAKKLTEKINQRVNKVLHFSPTEDKGMSFPLAKDIKASVPSLPISHSGSLKAKKEKTLQEIFLEQIEKQRTMFLQNLQLTPKISIKFYSVNKKTLEQKASIVSESVVDALEKRKAFRKVIKDAKETLMRSPGVKGVKIQVAGRLNGAEIARTEWVRAGRVPLQTLRANLDYSYRTANTIYGIIGVRVWIFKGIRSK